MPIKMKFSDAKKEFNIRLYRWAIVAQEKEISESFPSFQLCNGWPLKTCNFFRGLDRRSQLVLGKGLLQARHKEAVLILGETISTGAEPLMRQEEHYRLKLGSGSIRTNNSTGKKMDETRFATRNQLKKVMKIYFKDAFEKECLPSDPLDGKNNLIFRMKCNGWIIKTWFEFGRWDPEIRVEHNIWTGKWITPTLPEVLPANCLGFRLNYGNEIGIGSGWDNIAVEHIEPTCVAVMKHCRCMFDALPNLLDGLDLELLTT